MKAVFTFAELGLFGVSKAFRLDFNLYMFVFILHGKI